MDAKGVTPMPVATKTACSAEKMALDGAPWGPSRYTSKGRRCLEWVVRGRDIEGGRDRWDRWAWAETEGKVCSKIRGKVTVIYCIECSYVLIFSIVIGF